MSAKQANELAQRALQAYVRGRYDVAIRASREALRHAPNHPGLLFCLGSSQVRFGNPARGLANLQRVDELDPDRPDVLVEIAQALQTLDRPAESLETVERALAISPDSPGACRAKASVLRQTGRAEEAMAFIEPRANADPASTALACEFADLCRILERQQDGAEALERVLERDDMPPIERRSALFRLGQLLDELGRTDEAFARIAEANPPPPPKCITPAAPIMTGWTRKALEQFPAASPEVAKRGPVPVLVVGMPRSGTTLIDRVLTGHPGVGSVGESQLLFQAAHELAAAGTAPTQAWVDERAARHLEALSHAAPGATHVVDKMPANYMHLGLASRLLPNARIIHARRDPRDVCLSCYFQQFNLQLAYSQDPATCARQCLEHDKTMDHWRRVLDAPVHDLWYETLVTDPEPTIRAAFGHLGLGFDERCLAFNRQGDHVTTASWAQVKRPLYATSAGKWRRYAHHLEPMLRVLGDHGTPPGAPDDTPARREERPDA